VNALWILWAGTALIPAQSASPVLTRGPRAVLLPVKTAPSAPTEIRNAAGGVERALRGALMRHASFHLMTRKEIVTMMGQAAQQQLMGCSADACLAAVAQALDADYLITSHMDSRDGLWLLNASVLERRKAGVSRRGAIRARSLDNLLASVDALARELAVDQGVSFDDTRLAERLGTNASTLAAFRKERSGTGSFTDQWTAFLIKRNQESSILPLLMSGVVLGTSAATGLLLALFVPPQIALNDAIVRNRPADPARLDGNATYEFPILAEVTLVMATGGLFLAGGAGLAALAGLTAVDLLDVERVPVSQDGCCRDESRVDDSASPGVAKRLAPLVAAIGGIIALLTPAVYIAFTLVLSLQRTVTVPQIPDEALGPTLRLPASSYAAVPCLNGILLVAIFGLTFGLGSLGLLTALGLVFTDRTLLVDPPRPAREDSP
jgi:hypothetical protein